MLHFLTIFKFNKILIFISPGPVVQGQALAREVLPVLQVPRVPGRQAVRQQDGEDLLRPVLRLSVCDPLRRLLRDLQSW